MLDEGAGVDGAALKAAILDKTPYDLAKLTIEVVAELPMTPTGKISKADLSALYEGKP